MSKPLVMFAKIMALILVPMQISAQSIDGSWANQHTEIAGLTLMPGLLIVVVKDGIYYGERQPLAIVERIKRGKMTTAVLENGKRVQFQWKNDHEAIITPPNKPGILFAKVVVQAARRPVCMKDLGGGLSVSC